MHELTVVIPTLRRAGVLAQALDRLERQNGADGRFEVVVVSDAAEDDPGAVDHAIGERPFAVRHLRAPAPGVSCARNAGWRASDAPLVLFLGDDILAGERLVAEHLEGHRAHPEPEAGVLGHVRWADALPHTPFMRWLDSGWQFDYPAIRGEDAGWGRFYACNASLKRELLERSGGFDESFRFGCEELELARRLHDLGFRLYYEPDARAEHLHEPTLAAWRERMAIAARAELQLEHKHPDLPPYFLARLREALERPAPRGLAARLARFVPPSFPLLGPRVWGSVDACFRRELAPAYMAAREEARRERVAVER